MCCSHEMSVYVLFLSLLGRDLISKLLENNLLTNFLRIYKVYYIFKLSSKTKTDHKADFDIEIRPNDYL